MQAFNDFMTAINPFNILNWIAAAYSGLVAGQMFGMGWTGRGILLTGLCLLNLAIAVGALLA